ncbi:MAG: hypothetical protein VXW65_00180 [Pseudomonadota bacterium]|nr:hypothetical protein [Pseudomonadota bacterium]
MERRSVVLQALLFGIMRYCDPLIPLNRASWRYGADDWRGVLNIAVNRSVFKKQTGVMQAYKKLPTAVE